MVVLRDSGHAVRRRKEFFIEKLVYLVVCGDGPSVEVTRSVEIRRELRYNFVRVPRTTAAFNLIYEANS